MEPTKLCKECGIEKPLSSFSVRGKNKLPMTYCKPCISLKNRASQVKVRSKALELLGNKCVRCGFSDARALQIDHVNGGGKQEYKEVGTYRICLNVINGIDGYQLLCANCNWIKRHEEGEQGGHHLLKPEK